MLHIFFKKKNFFPFDYYDSIYSIDYKKLYDDGIRLILTDLDNTLISYKDSMPNEKLIEWKKKLIARESQIPS